MKISVATVLAFATAGVLGNGFIQCIDGSVNGGVGTIPAHNFVYSFDDGQAFYCGPLVEDCEEMRGDGSWENTYVNCEGSDGGSESASFWITSDGCYNICSGGNHMYCCGQNGAGGCVTTDFGPGC